MVDYDFYINTYLGSAIPEKNFPAAAARAAAVLEGYERRCRVQCSGPDSRRMALCAMAEVIHSYGTSRFVDSATAKGIAVALKGSTEVLHHQLVRRCRLAAEPTEVSV